MQKGFTVVEICVALAIMGIICGIIIGALIKALEKEKSEVQLAPQTVKARY